MEKIKIKPKGTNDDDENSALELRTLTLEVDLVRGPTRRCCPQDLPADGNRNKIPSVDTVAWAFGIGQGCGGWAVGHTLIIMNSMHGCNFVTLCKFLGELTSHKHVHFATSILWLIPFVIASRVVSPTQGVKPWSQVFPTSSNWGCVMFWLPAFVGAARIVTNVLLEDELGHCELLMTVVV